MPDAKTEAWTLSTIRPTKRATKLAFGMILLSVLTCAAAGPIAKTPLTKLDAFIPAYEVGYALHSRRRVVTNLKDPLG
jgi:ATP-dependent exoDNAse (exonuclease V) alpha subunit